MTKSDAKAKWNEACPCGSGKMFKGCHGPARKDFMRVFQIGFNKCATGSLYNFFKKNGHRSIHYGEGQWDVVLHNNHKVGKRLCVGYEDIVFWSDIIYIQKHFEVLAHQYPNAKFIYNIRPLDDWIKSRREHYHPVSLDQHFIHKHKLKERKVDIEQYWRSEWITFDERVREFFCGKNRDRLLIYDITKNTGKDIINFLPDLKFKNETFPHISKTTPESVRRLWSYYD